MGYQPVPPRRVPGLTLDQVSYRMARATGADGEAFHLYRVREAFARGELDLDALERSIEHVLRGGYLGEAFDLRPPIMPQVGP